MTRPSLAVVGSGISGLVAAYELRHSHRVTIFEADDRLGGHSDTHSVTAPDGSDLAIDSGFIVHNEKTYPILRRIFAELDVPTQETEMSLSVACDECGLTFAGAKGARGLLAKPSKIFSPRYVRLLAEVPRFHRAALAELAAAREGTVGPLTWGEFLAREKFSPYFVQHYALPLISCVWSSGHEDSANYPAHHLFEFLDNHGLLTIGGSPTWRTVVGGSRVYVDRIRAAIEADDGEVRLASPRHLDQASSSYVQVESESPNGPRSERFDQVVLATHADIAGQILTDATEDERADLACIGYSHNPTVLHTDSAVLPSPARARASWNYRLESCTAPQEVVLVSYWMNNLHRLGDVGADYLVTLNPTDRIDQESVIVRREYSHPIFTHDAVAAAARLRDAGGPRLAFAGAHLGWGFHEDGARSGHQAAMRLAAAAVPAS